MAKDPRIQERRNLIAGRNRCIRKASGIRNNRDRNRKIDMCHNAYKHKITQLNQPMHPLHPQHRRFVDKVRKECKGMNRRDRGKCMSNINNYVKRKYRAPVIEPFGTADVTGNEMFVLLLIVILVAYIVYCYSNAQ
jgi:hypothetical protein